MQTTAADSYRKSTVREYFESICIAVILALFVRTFVVQAFKIPTGSMENNLLIGDHLIVNKFVYAPTVSRSSACCCRSIRSGAATSSSSSIRRTRTAIS
jgi:signal peptidase I